MIRCLLGAASASALLAGAAQAEMVFNRIASFPVASNYGPGEDATGETSSEIIDVTGDGMTLVYTDSPRGVIGFVDITDPKAPKPLGALDMGGEPTSVSVIGGTAFVGVNTSESYTNPSGKLVVVDVAMKTVKGSCDLGGQPDSVGKAKDGSFISIAIENERDEDLGDGGLPQMPAGYLVQVQVAADAADCGTLKKIDMTGLAGTEPGDPEPEFVDINGLGETVLTLQENNSLAIIDSDGKVMTSFDAGAVDLEGIDATDERAALIFTESQPGRLREPDGVNWIDDAHFATANEGDWKGGSRGWTIWDKTGAVVWDSGTSFEYAAIEAGHYPDKRSDAKGIEPEAIEFGKFGDTPIVFVGAERASLVGVYDLTDPTAPVLKQLLPSGIGPEGMLAIPERNLFVTANENDLIEDGGARSHVMIYERAEGEASYPMLTSAGTEELIGWGAMSGLVAADETTLYAINDSFYGFQPTIFKIDVSSHPAKITEAIRVTRGGQPAQKLDMEGITLDGDGGFWVASEGNTDKLVPHALYHVNKKGVIKQEIAIPAELAALEKRFGFEGITLIDGKLWMAVQREWGDDPKGSVKLVSYDPEAKEWGAVRYPLDPKGAGWMGLSEITLHGDHVYIIERDNQIGTAAVTKKVYRVPVAELKPAALGGDLPVVTKELVRDLIPDLQATGGYVVDKVEGLAITPAGKAWVVTDNDGVDDSSGETLLFSFDVK